MALPVMAIPQFMDPDDPRAKLRGLTANPSTPALNLLPALNQAVTPSLSANPSSLTPLANPAGLQLVPPSTNALGNPAPRLQRINGAMGSAPAPQTPDLGGNTPPDLGLSPLPNVGRQASDPAMRLGVDQGELQRLQSTGPGVDQIQNPWLRGFAKVGDAVASVVAPGLATFAPGTALHNRMLQHQAMGRIGEDQGELQGAATLADSQAQAVQRQALATQEQAKAQAMLNPKPSEGDLLYDKNGSPLGFRDGAGNYYGPQDPNLPQGVRDVLASAQRKQPTSAFELWQQQNPKGSADDYLKLEAAGKVKGLPEQLLEAEQNGDTTTAGHILRVIQQTQVQPKIDVHSATERPEASGTWALAQQPDGNGGQKSVMFNSKTGEVRDAPAGLSKQSALGNARNAKIGADEQKRADLAKNMGENLDALDDISKRRPDLFGALAGRLTDAKVALGTSDPDISQLEVIKHQLGMVAQGAHGMRSAQGVESAANSLLNGYHNSPEATRSATKAARDSVQTFLQDSQNPGQPRSAPAMGGAATPGTHVFSASGWQRANPGGNIGAATAAAKAQGYEVTQ